MKGLARVAAERLEDAEDEDDADDPRDSEYEEDGWR